MADNKKQIESLSQESHQTIEGSMPDKLTYSDGMLVDSMPDTDVILADNMVNRKDSTVDSTASIEDSTVDSTMEDSQNAKKFQKFYIKELEKKYRIGRSSLYKRMEYLQITSWKELNKAYLDAEQVKHMDGLHKYIESTNRMEGYPVPAPSGPNSLQQQTVEAFVVPEQRTMEECSIEVSPDEKLNNRSNSLPDGKRQHTNSGTEATEAIASLVKNAQNKATGVLIAENMLAQQFIQNPDALPSELQEKIKQSAQMPEVDPFVYANALMSMAQNSVGFPTSIG